MERNIEQLIRALDHETGCRKRGKVNRDYVLYQDAYANSRESHPPYIYLRIRNPRGKANPTSADKYAEFKVILELEKPPVIEQVVPLEETLKILGFEIPPVDSEGNCYGGEPGDMYAGSIKGMLTLHNYPSVFTVLINSYTEAHKRRHEFMRPFEQGAKDNRGWILKELLNKLDWTYQILQSVYKNAQPLTPRETRIRKRRKLF